MFKRKILYMFLPAAIIFAVSGCSRIINEPMAATRSIIQAPSSEMPLREAPSGPQTKPRSTPSRGASSAPPMRNTQPQVPHSQPSQTNASVTIPVQHSLSRELASHETEFDAKDKNRSNNISRAAETINGTVIQPGETFSYNKTVGPTNEQRGYKKSTIFIEGEKTEGVGGGVCQVSTTLFNAAENAGLTILERHDHSRPVTYAESGEEAATSYGGIDMKFKNDKPYPIVINSYVIDGKIKVTINAI